MRFSSGHVERVLRVLSAVRQLREEEGVATVRAVAEFVGEAPQTVFRWLHAMVDESVVLMDERRHGSLRLTNRGRRIVAGDRTGLRRALGLDPDEPAS